MARKPRMGRNLNALLNSGGRERREAADEPATDEPAEAADRANTDDRSMSPETSREASHDATADANHAATAPSRETATPDDAHASSSSTSAATKAAAAALPVIGTPVEAVERERGRSGDRLSLIGIERIRRGVYQPRRVFDPTALQELADSLRVQGMIQPIIVREFGGAFELIAGERRWRAAQLAGLDEIPAIVREMQDESVAAVSLIENIQREDLNPLEEAQALSRLCDEFGMTHAAVAASIGRSRASVSNLMRLLDLHDEVKLLVDKGELDMGHARALLGAPTADQPALAQRIVAQGLTVRAVEQLIRAGADKPAPTARADDVSDPDIDRLVERLSGVLGAGVKIHHKTGGAGRLEIRYGSLDELDGILAHIK